MPIVPEAVTSIPVYLRVESVIPDKVSTGFYLHPETGELISVYELKRTSTELTIKYKTIDSMQGLVSTWSTGPYYPSTMLRFKKVILP